METLINLMGGPETFESRLDLMVASIFPHISRIKPSNS
jgi:hypothetical protein